MKILFLLLLVGCSTQEREVQQVCELKCTDCKYVELKCDTNHNKENRELG